MFVHESTRRQEVNLNEPIQAVIQIAEPFIKSNGVVLEVYLTDEGPPLVMADPVQLQQVIFNLVINAVEAMAQAGNGARILKLWSQVTPDRTILVRVVDSGPGIDPKIAERLFQPFTTTKASGMGLGLSICREIVEAHSGQLTAFPNKPHGTEFQIILPASDVRN